MTIYYLRMNKSQETQFAADKSYDEARQWASEAHSGQVRDFSNDPYITHPLRVAAFIHDRGDCSKSKLRDRVLIGLFHDILEDTNITPTDMRERWGDVVTDGVLLLTEPYKLRDNISMTREQRKAEFKAQLLAAPTRIQDIKLCDILDNTMDMCRFAHMNVGRAQRFYNEKHDLVNSFPAAAGVTLKKEVNDWLEILQDTINLFKHKA